MSLNGLVDYRADSMVSGKEDNLYMPIMRFSTVREVAVCDDNS